MKKINIIGVVGSGRMGCGIAQVSCLAGYEVILTDSNPAIIEKSLNMIKKNIAELVEKGSLEKNQAEQFVSRIKGAAEISSMARCDLVVEAVFEDFDIKKGVLTELATVCSPETIIASNTSSLSISKLGSGLCAMERIVGMHFFNPVPVMALVEIVKTVQTSTETLEKVVEFAKTLGKKPVVARDQAGFVVNLLLTPFLFDAVRALSEGVCSVQEIDDSLRYGCGHPMGPLALCDFIGLDILVSAGNAMFEEYHDKKYAPPPLLKRLVDVGDYGVKSGRGFYEHRGEGKPVSRVFS